MMKIFSGGDGMLMYIATALIFNFFSFVMVRIYQAGRFTYNHSKYPAFNGRVFLVAGMMAQPEKTYARIEMPYSVRVNLNYSLLGYNPKNAGKQLEEMALSEDYLIGLGTGCKAIIYSHRDDVKRILINPATHSIAFKAEYQMWLRYTPILVGLSCILGWISAIPIIPTKSGNFYSLALLSDQLYWSYYGDPRFNDLGKVDKTGLIVSEYDKYVVNYISESIYQGAKVREIKTEHGKTVKEHSKYDAAIKQLLAKD